MTRNPRFAELHPFPDPMAQLREWANEAGLGSHPIANRILDFAEGQTEFTDQRGPGTRGLPYKAASIAEIAQCTGLQLFHCGLKEILDGQRLMMDTAAITPGGLSEIENPSLPELDKAVQLLSSLPVFAHKVDWDECNGLKYPIITVTVFTALDIPGFIGDLDEPIVHLFAGLAYGFGADAVAWFVQDHVK